MTPFPRRAVLVLPLLLAACAAEPPMRPVSPHALSAARLDPDAALARLNAYRARAGLRPVAFDPALMALARQQAEAMAAADRMSHDVKGPFASRLAAAGLSAGEAGENVCAGYFSTADAMQAWERSPEHDANLKLAPATRFGIALAKNPESGLGTFWAMAIASPAPL